MVKYSSTIFLVRGCRSRSGLGNSTFGTREMVTGKLLQFRINTTWKALRIKKFIITAINQKFFVLQNITRLVSGLLKGSSLISTRGFSIRMNWGGFTGSGSILPDTLISGVGIDDVSALSLLKRKNFINEVFLSRNKILRTCNGFKKNRNFQLSHIFSSLRSYWI